MRIITLIEDTGTAPYTSEHGLSFYIEYKGKNYLLDMGSDDQFAKNAKLLNADLEKVDSAILSHAHYDHAGGLGTFFRINRTADVYMQKAVNEGIYLSASKGPLRDIGPDRDVLEAYQSRIRPVNGDLEINDGVRLIAHRPYDTGNRARAGKLYKKIGGRVVPDDFKHEQTLVFETPEGLVVLNSCSHVGAERVVREILSALPGRKIRAFIGGFHLMGSGGINTISIPESEIRALAETLAVLPAEQYYTGHCTGDAAFAIMKPVLGGRIRRITTGTVIDIS